MQAINSKTYQQKFRYVLFEVDEGMVGGTWGGLFGHLAPEIVPLPDQFGVACIGLGGGQITDVIVGP